MAVKWAYGVTTTPVRKDDLLPRTLQSLYCAGFETPRLFIDDCHDSTPYKNFGLPFIIRGDKVRTHGNWVLSMYELYIREPGANYFAIFQDDFVTYPNLRQYLEKCEYPKNGYWNLYTFPKNQDLAPKDGSTGWYLSNQKGLGAVALVLDNRATQLILASAYMVGRPQNAKRGHRAVDGGIVSAFAEVGWKEYVHNPSLVQHTGKVSSMGNKKQQLAPSFRGEDFNCLELL